MRARGTVSEEDLDAARRLKGRARRYRSGVERARHRDPMGREFPGIPRTDGPARMEEIRG